MNISMYGISHKTSTIDIRENYYLNDIQKELFLSELKNSEEISEAFILSTCNRTEIYFRSLKEYPIDLSYFLKRIFKIKKLPYSTAHKDCFYSYQEKEALRHLFFVATGLDSLVIGEKQILGQVKNAFDMARDKGALSTYFNILSQLVIKAGKKSQAETNIGVGGSSVSWAAIAKAEQTFPSLENKSVLFIGAGQMSRLAVGQVLNKKFHKLYFMNRTHSLAQHMAENFQGEAVTFSDIKEVLRKVDLCICSASAPHYILERDTVEKAFSLRKNKCVFIDISMPRNLDPTIAELPDAELYSIDDLQNVVEENMRCRKEAITQVKEMIDQKIQAFACKLVKVKQFNTDYFVHALINQNQ